MQMYYTSTIDYLVAVGRYDVHFQSTVLNSVDRFIWPNFRNANPYGLKEVELWIEVIFQADAETPLCELEMHLRKVTDELE